MESLSVALSAVDVITKGHRMKKAIAFLKRLLAMMHPRQQSKLVRLTRDIPKSEFLSTIQSVVVDRVSTAVI
jgi:hypothetical protein